MTLISALTPVVTPALADEYEIEQAAASFKITGTQIMTLLAANISLDAARITTGTLAAARGGTGVSNAGTLTNASNTTITGGGTLALAGFTLTVPATGSAALLAVANVFTAAQTAQRDAIGTTSTDGLVLANATAAAAGAQQYSPRLRLTGQGWKTNATAASQTVDFTLYTVPVQGAANPTAQLNIDFQVNAGGYTNMANIDSLGRALFAVTTGGSAANVAVGISTNRGLFSPSAGLVNVSAASDTASFAGTVGMTVGSGHKIGFSASAAPGTSAQDTALGRNAAGTVEINNGTAGQWGSLLAGVRDANLSSAIDTLTIGHQISAGTVATNCGIGMMFNVATDNAGTPVQDVNAARVIVSWATAANATRKARMTLNVYDQTNTREWLRGETNGAAMIGFLGANAAIRQTSGGNLTNNVTSGGTTDQIDNFTDLTIYANDSAAIRNDIYQLARKLKQVNDSLRTYGLLT